VVTFVLPSTGELETTGDGTSPTQAQMDEEMESRRDIIDVAILLTPSRLTSSRYR
jgi:hypothetical protein